MRPVLCNAPDRILIPTEFGVEVWSRSGLEKTLRTSLVDADAHHTLTCLCATSDGKHVLAGTRNGVILHWDPSKPQEPHVIDLTNIALFESNSSRTVLSIALDAHLRCVVLLRDAVLLMHLETNRIQPIAHDALPNDAGSITCSADLSTVAVASPCEITLFTTSFETTETMKRITSCVGHVQLPTAMAFCAEKTLLSSDAKILVTLLWDTDSLRSSASPTDSDVQYCDTCYTTASVVEDIIFAGSSALFLHRDKSMTVWRVNQKANAMEQVHAFPSTECDALIARATAPDNFEISYFTKSSELAFGGVQCDASGTWRVQTTANVRMARRNDRERKPAASSRDMTETSLPVYEEISGGDQQAEDNAHQSNGRVPIRLQQALNTADQREFERVLAATDSEHIAKSVRSVSSRHAETLLQLLSGTLQGAQNNVERVGMAITWVKAVLIAHKTHIYAMDQRRRVALLTPLRSIIGEFAQLEDTVHSFQCRVRCLHELQEKYEPSRGGDQDKQQFFFRLQ